MNWKTSMLIAKAPMKGRKGSTTKRKLNTRRRKGNMERRKADMTGRRGAMEEKIGAMEIQRRVIAEKRFWRVTGWQGLEWRIWLGGRWLRQSKFFVKIETATLHRGWGGDKSVVAVKYCHEHWSIGRGTNVQWSQTLIDLGRQVCAMGRQNGPFASDIDRSDEAIMGISLKHWSIERGHHRNYLSTNLKIPWMQLAILISVSIRLTQFSFKKHVPLVQCRNMR